MNKSPLVSIVCITFNHEKYIRQALDSFIAQKTDFNFEIIVSDDSSADKTPEIIKEYADLSPSIVIPILRKKNLGARENFIDTLNKARGKYIALCEGDDYWIDNNKLQTQVNLLERKPQLVGCFHRSKVINEGDHQSSFVYPDVEDKFWYTTENLLKINYIPTSSVVYRRCDYKKLAHDGMPFDWYFHIYHLQFGKIQLVDRLMSVYRKHPGGLWWEFDRDRSKIWKQYGLAFLKLWLNVMSIFPNDKKLSKIVDEQINAAMENLVESDLKYNCGLVRQGMLEAPENFAQMLIERTVKVSQLTKEIEENSEIINDLRSDRTKMLDIIDDQKESISDLRQSLKLVTESLTWRTREKIVKIKDKFH